MFRKYIPSLNVFKLFFFVGIVWAAIVGPFSSILILQSFGASSSLIGIFSSISAVLSMVFQPVWGLLGDKINSPRRVLCFNLGISGIFFGCVLLTNNLYIAAGLMLLDITFRCSTIALLDSHTLSEISTIPRMQYSYIRMSGSVFYGIMSFIYSGIINARGVISIIPVSLCIMVFAVFWGFFAAKGQWESSRNQGSSDNKVKRNLKSEAASLLRNKPYIIFVLYASFSALSTGPVFNFIIFYVTAVGGNPGDVPMIHAIRCITEIPMFVLIGLIGKKYGARKLILTGMGFSFVYIIGLLFSNSLLGLTLSHALAGAPAFILGLSGRMRYLSELTPLSVRSTSITVMYACEIGLGSITGNLIAGFLLGIYGTHVLTLVALGALFASAITLMLIPRRV